MIVGCIFVFFKVERADKKHPMKTKSLKIEMISYASLFFKAKESKKVNIYPPIFNKNKRMIKHI